MRRPCLAAVIAGLAGVLVAGARAEPPEVISIESLLALPRVGGGGRAPVYTDAVEHALVTGTWSEPGEGDEVSSPGRDPEAWERLEAGGGGRFDSRALAGGWACAVVESPVDRVMMLEARGHRAVYVNGEARMGDVYDLGYVVVPVRLRAGENVLLFRGSRGSLSARLVAPASPVMIESRDATLPDVIVGEMEDLWAGLIVTNAGTQWLEGLRIESRTSGGEAVVTPVAPIPPLGVFKAPVRIGSPALIEGAAVPVEVRLVDGGGEVVALRSLSLTPRLAHERHVRTFVSEIDGSVQYYAVTPPPGPIENGAMILSLHGASVEATSQAGAYAPKDWAWVVAPTNRRPFGFDWEDWGRLDAMEVLELASARFGTDPERTYLTGHSMGGHGTWILGAQMAPRFAAIAPSAGWTDFWSYVAPTPPPRDGPIGATLWRAANASRTLLLETNYRGLGIYVLHGDADDNVPVGQARAMRERLGAFHPNFAYYERAGAGHWWGNECVDWPPLIDFLSCNRRAAPASVDFSTIDPGISATSGWVTIDAQETPREVSRVVAGPGPGGPIVVTTENVFRLWLNVPPGERAEPWPGGQVVIDGQTIPWAEGALGLERGLGGAWQVADVFDPSHKTPDRAGPFKDAFRHRVLFVVGTRGTPEENAWALAKARYDAEALWYRGNGAVEIVTDEMFDPLAEPDRGVILYGHRQSNGAWDALLAGSPVVVERGRVRVGDRTVEGEGLACLFIRPRPGSAVASVGVVGGSGMEGLRLTTQLPYFTSGAHYPDWTILDASMLLDPGGGLAGVVGCGFFDPDWSVGNGSAWRDMPASTVP